MIIYVQGKLKFTFQLSTFNFQLVSSFCLKKQRAKRVRPLSVDYRLQTIYRSPFYTSYKKIHTSSSRESISTYPTTNPYFPFTFYHQVHPLQLPTQYNHSFHLVLDIHLLPTHSKQKQKSYLYHNMPLYYQPIEQNIS